LGVVLTQLDDDGGKFVMTYASWSNKKMKVIICMKGNASLLLEQFHHSNVIFMIAHSFWLQIINL
jgi:hypothetical protein